jgi:hypothetical protein
MKSLYIKILAVVLMLATLKVSAAPPPQGISGPVAVLPGTTHTYSTDQSFVAAPMWEIAVGAGTINSTWISGTTYYASVTWTNSGLLEFYDEVEGAYVSKNVAVVKEPIPVSASRCGSGSVKLTATPVGGNTVRWFTQATGGTMLRDSLSYTSNVTATTTYYIESYHTTGAVASPRVAITATVNSLVSNAPTSVTNGVSCGTGQVTISAVPASPGNSILWYASSTSVEPIYTGLCYTKSLTATTTYYASSYNSTTGCSSSARTAVAAEIKAKPYPQ